jgi:hypothetical protein
MNGDRDRNIEHRLTRLEILIAIVIAQSAATWFGVGPDVAQAAIKLFQ